MDTLHAIGFYVSAAVSLAGAVAVAFFPTRARRGLGLAVVGLGLAGLYISLSAGFVALVALVAYAVIALLVARPDYRQLPLLVTSDWRQAGAVGATILLAALVYAAYSGDFARATFFGGPINTIAVGRLLLTHDAVATEAMALVALIALVGSAAVWRRERRDERAREPVAREQRSRTR